MNRTTADRIAKEWATHTIGQNEPVLYGIQVALMTATLVDMPEGEWSWLEADSKLALAVAGPGAALFLLEFSDDKHSYTVEAERLALHGDVRVRLSDNFENDAGRIVLSRHWTFAFADREVVLGNGHETVGHIDNTNPMQPWDLYTDRDKSGPEEKVARSLAASLGWTGWESEEAPPSPPS